MDFVFRIAGMAGDGVKAAGVVAAKIFTRLGYHAFVHTDYQSLIRGGHNASVVRISDREIKCHEEESDLLIALQDYVIPLHSEYSSRVIFDSSKFDYPQGEALPMTDFAREVKAPLAFRNASALGALCFLYGVDLDVLKGIYRDTYGEKGEKDVLLAEKGYGYAREELEPLRELRGIGEPTALFEGNQAVALGAVKAGLKNYYAYPMTPSSSLLHFLAANKKKLGLEVLQPENEIAAAAMALGSAYAGARAMVGTSGGGFALMQESFSLAGMAELPVVFMESQRGGPSTGLPTYHAQEDLRFVLHAGQGEFPRLVASPGDAEDAFYLAGELLNLAWKYQTPAVLLADRYLSESYITAEVEEGKVEKEPSELYRGGFWDYKRYRKTPSGVSPLAFPPQARVKATANEHDEHGYTEDSARGSSEMYAKRMRKEEGIREELKGKGLVTFGEGRDTIFTWGSTTGSVVEAAGELDARVAQVRYLSPFPRDEIEKLEFGKAVTVECNYGGQLNSLLREHCGIEGEHIGRWDGRPFVPGELVKKLGEVRNCYK